MELPMYRHIKDKNNPILKGYETPSIYDELKRYTIAFIIVTIILCILFVIWQIRN